MDRPTRKKPNIIFIMFIYWVAIIAWQFVRPVANRSLLDTLVKIGVFLIVFLYSIMFGKPYTSRRHAIILSLGISTQILTFLFDASGFSLGGFITFAFMMAQILVFIVLLGDEEIGEKEFVRFAVIMVLLVLFMCVYNIFAYWNRFFSLFAGGRAYGNECKSILYSNHEFAVYISTGMILALWLLIKKRLNPILFSVITVFFSISLMSTYSRSAIFGIIGAIFVLLFFYRKSIFALFSIAFAGLLAIIVAVPFLNSFVFDKLMKDTFDGDSIMDASRSEMYSEMWGEYLDSGVFRTFFGHGYSGASNFPGHDAYLVILLTGGIVMMIFFALIILWSLYNSCRALRYDKCTGGVLLAFQTFSLLYMVAQTPILFYSSMDSFFITMITVMIPLYTYNRFAHKAGGNRL